MIKNNQWAIFDFCETLVCFQTADAFIDFIKNKSNSKKIKVGSFVLRLVNKSKVFSLINRISKRNQYLYKQLKLRLLSGLSETEILRYAKEYFDEKIKPNLIYETTEKLKKLQKLGFKIIIVSGGYSIYIQFFAKEFNVDVVIANQISFKDNICRGKIDGLECMGDNKILLLNKFFKDKPAYSETYSDNFSDLPLLQWSDKAFVVSKQQSQKWPEKYGFNEIIWK